MAIIRAGVSWSGRVYKHPPKVFYLPHTVRAALFTPYSGGWLCTWYHEGWSHDATQLLDLKQLSTSMKMTYFFVLIVCSD